MYDYEALWMQRYGGVSRCFFELYRRINGRNDIDIYIPVAGAQNAYFKEKLRYKNYSFFVNRVLNEFKTSWDIIKRRFSGENYDLIHLTYCVPYIWPLFVNWKKTKCVITVHDMIHELVTHKKRFIKAQKKWIGRADGIVCVSEQTKKDMLNIYPEFKNKNIEVIYHGNGFFQSIDDNKDVNNHIGTSQYILYVGTRSGYKNFEIVIKALSLWINCEDSKNIGDVKLLCVGGGAFSLEELKMQEEYGIRQKVVYKECRDQELVKLYSNAKFLVFPSKYEGFGLPIVEAFSSRCPIILADQGCFREIAGDAALYFEADNAEMLLAKMKELFDENKRIELIEKGQEQLKNYDWDKSAMKLTDFYRKIKCL